MTTLKKRKRKSRKIRKREAVIDSSTNPENGSIVQVKKRKKLSKNVTTSTIKDNSNNNNNKEEPLLEATTQPKKVSLLGKDLATRVDETNIKKLRHTRLNSEVDFLDIGICADFKRTGYCGWGDTCIYAHIREDYKSSFELAKDFEEEMKKKEEQKDQEPIEEKGYPTECSLCEKEFKNPIMTQCSHYFCEKCIIDHFKKTGNHNCPICGTDTKGMLNSAVEMIKIFKRREKKKKEEKERKKKEGDDLVEEKRETRGWSYK